MFILSIAITRQMLRTLLGVVALGVLPVLQAGCGTGGSGGASGSSTPAAPILSAKEAAAVTDAPDVYAVEDTTKVISANVITYDGVYTFEQVNNDLDPDDSWIPEVDAHFTADTYPDDGKAVNATLRLRGSTSRLAPQKSYRIKFKSGITPWRGETTLQLNKHPWDLTRVRNKLAFDLFLDIPHLPSLRTQFMHLTINGQDYGLYTHIEKRGKEYLSRRGLPTDSNIYKANSFNFSSDARLALNAQGQPASLASFESVLELENDSKEHSKLIAMVNAVNDYNVPFDDTFSTYFDQDNYLAWLAVNILVGNYDTQNQNFSLYQAKDTAKFYFMPWDYDDAFGTENQPDHALLNNMYPAWRLGVANWWESPLHSRFISDPRHLADLKSAVDEIYANYLTPARIRALLDQYKGQVYPFIVNAPDKTYLPVVTGSSADEWAGEYARIVDTIKTNYNRFQSSIEYPMPFAEAAEIVGSNLHVYWSNSLDLQNDAVTYAVQIADNPQFNPVYYSRASISGFSLDVPKPRSGIYYLRVTATDSKGNSTGAFESHYENSRTYFGVIQIAIQ